MSVGEGRCAAGGRRPTMVAAWAGLAHALIEGFEFRVPDLVAAQCYPDRRRCLAGSEQEGVRFLVGQVFSGWESSAAEYCDRAGSGVWVGVPGGLGVRAVLGELAGGLCRDTGAGGGDGECAAGGVPDDDERCGLLAVEHGWVVAVWGLRWSSHSSVPIVVTMFASFKGMPVCTVTIMAA